MEPTFRILWQMEFQVSCLVWLIVINEWPVILSWVYLVLSSMLARLEQWVTSFKFHFYALVCYLCRSQSALGASCMGWCICGHCWFCQYAKWSMQHRVSIHAWMCCPCLVICSQGSCQLMTYLFLLMFCWWHMSWVITTKSFCLQQSMIWLQWIRK